MGTISPTDQSFIVVYIETFHLLYVKLDWKFGADLRGDVHPDILLNLTSEAKSYFIF